jgi:hypothetical protein
MKGGCCAKVVSALDVIPMGKEQDTSGADVRLVGYAVDLGEAASKSPDARFCISDRKQVSQAGRQAA